MRLFGRLVNLMNTASREAGKEAPSSGSFRLIPCSAVIAALVWLGFAPQAAFAQSLPTTISFQGRLTDNNNNPLSGTYNFAFYICPNSTPCDSGSPIWTETQNGISVTNGVLAVQLGASNPLAPSDFTSAGTYLEIKVGGPGGQALSPLQPLAAVPYALSVPSIQGKQYISSAATPSGPDALGDLWYNTAASALEYYNGTQFVAVSTSSIASLPPTLAYQNQSNTFTAPQTISGSSLTLTGSNGYITSQSSVTASAFFGNGAGLTNLPAPANAAYVNQPNTFTQSQTVNYGVSAATGTFSGLLTANGGVTVGPNQSV
ncbi:MAG TPA: hypothetical protein VNK24_01325, partial [Elusimicrobiota bacterium]|nr:hypothetical protein [Elusimicrobiota bacterium]